MQSIYAFYKPWSCIYYRKSYFYSNVHYIKTNLVIIKQYMFHNIYKLILLHLYRYFDHTVLFYGLCDCVCERLKLSLCVSPELQPSVGDG